METPRSDAFVFFGATGDLAHKQIWPALSALVKAKRLAMPIVTIGRKDIGVEGIRDKARQSLVEAKAFDDASFATLAQQLSYVAVDYDDPKTFDAIKQAVGSAKHPLSYVALPPDVFEKVAKNLAQAGLAEGGRLVLEKPFGHDAASAKALSEALYAFFPEPAIFRIDHYLGKEQVENLVYFRAANPIFEAVLNREHVACVEITMAEEFGVKGRAEFYDAVGAIRDVVQNHLLEVVACIAMDLPAARGHAPLREARTKLLTCVEELRSEHLVCGQVRGYLSEKGVAPNSKTETFAALELSIGSPRWGGVPFFVRTGKELAVTASDVTVRFKSLGHPVLEDSAAPAQNTLRFRLGSGNTVALAANLKTPGEAMRGTSSELRMERPTNGDLQPYERLLGDAIDGDPTMYADRVAVEQAWRVFDAALSKAPPPYPYDPKSWGPAEAARVAPEGGWHNPEE